MKKGFVIGLATGLTVAGASLVLANSQKQAILNNQIKVTLNGQVQEFKDETTNETQYPITYHDRTYLPLRTVADLVGVDVDYDAITNTAIIEKNIFSNYFESIDGATHINFRSNVFYEDSQFGDQFEVYNIKDGSIITKEDLMQIRNISENDVNNRVKKYIDDCILRAKESWDFNEDVLKSFSESIKSVNTMDRIKIFVNEKGGISLVVNCPDRFDGLWAFSVRVPLQKFLA